MNDTQSKIAAYLCRQVYVAWLDSESNPSNEDRAAHCTVAVDYKGPSNQSQHRLVSLAAEMGKCRLEFHQTKFFTREINRHMVSLFFFFFIHLLICILYQFFCLLLSGKCIYHGLCNPFLLGVTWYAVIISSHR